MVISDNSELPISFNSELVSKLQDLTLDYKKNDWLKHTFGLLLLDHSEVWDCFSFDFMSDIPDESKYDIGTPIISKKI